MTDINNFIFVGLSIPFIFGIILGCYNKITIFNNYDDLGITFLMFILTIPMTYLYFLLGRSQITLYFFVTIEILILCFILYNSFIYNKKNIFYTLLALYIKIPLSFLYLINLLLILDDFFDKKINRKTTLSIILFATLTPIMAKLVKNNTGVLKQCQKL